MYQTILCATDFTDDASRAVDQAIELASQTGARLHVVHAIEPVPITTEMAAPTLASLPESRLPTVRSRMKRFVEAKSNGVGRITGHVEVGAAHEVIEDVANSIGADLLVLGTHGRSGLSRILLGSTTEKVLRTTERPVLAIPTEYEDDDG